MTPTAHFLTPIRVPPVSIAFLRWDDGKRVRTVYDASVVDASGHRLDQATVRVRFTAPPPGELW